MKTIATLVVIPKAKAGQEHNFELYYCGNCHAFLAKIKPTSKATNRSEFFFKERTARLHKPCPLCGIYYGRVSMPGLPLSPTLKDCFQTWEVSDDWK